MKIPLRIAEKLISLVNGEKLAGSSMKHASVEKMMEDGVLSKEIKGRSKSLIHLHDKKNWSSYLKNNFGIGDLYDYIEFLKNEDALRADAIEVSTGSKIKGIRTFKGFLINTIEPIIALLNGKQIIIEPDEGSFIFVYDYQTFIPEKGSVIVGIENPENFYHVRKQLDLFQNLKAIFVCRYPQSRDLVKWLSVIPNRYFHFGDFDFAGINIYLNEYKNHLGEKAQFLIPNDLELQLRKYGNRELYNVQFHLQLTSEKLNEPGLKLLNSLLHKYKKGLEQEVFIDNAK